MKALTILTAIFSIAVTGCTHVGDEVAHAAEDGTVTLLSAAATDILAQINAPIQVYEGIFSFYQETGNVPQTADELNFQIKKEKENEAVVTITQVEDMEVIDQVIIGKVSYLAPSKMITEENEKNLDIELDLNIDESELAVSYTEEGQQLIKMLELFSKMGEQDEMSN